ncbi:MAG: trimethylamine methyltransferase family protein [Thermoanaerobaculales bacterium]|nr:trimethylamine methyltransferase family protein [Thermoanaerobaculales bacterium]
MRPKMRLLTDELGERIVAEARDVLAAQGIELHDPQALSLLADNGAEVAGSRVRIGGDLIDQALATAPSRFGLFDVGGQQSHTLGDGEVHFTPASAATHILGLEGGEYRRPSTADYVEYANLVAGLPHFKSHSTAFIPADVDEKISDSYRLYLSLLHCPKPVVTGAFSIAGFEVMLDLLLTVRGSRAALAQKPLALFSCCPTSPLKWGDVEVRNLLDCAAAGVPIEIVPVPLAGFIAPVTIVGTLVQLTAEVLSGVVLAQLTRLGTPILFGCCPAIFDIRYETAPMGAVETMMIGCAAAEIGRFLNLPTQAYIALSDAKNLDAQAGLETSMGATLAVLAGIDEVAGPGMLDFINCFSLSKLVVDHEICAMALRLNAGIQTRGDFPAGPIMEELLAEKHLLIADHTRKHLRDEISFPGPTINRANRARWTEEGASTLSERAADEARRLLAEAEPPALAASVTDDLHSRMVSAARECGMDGLP